MLDGNPEGGPEGEGAEFHAPEEPTEVTPERTRELEIKANFEFWNQPYWAKALEGRTPKENDIRKEINKIPETEGMDFYVYVPKNITFEDMGAYLMESQGFDRYSQSHWAFDNPFKGISRFEGEPRGAFAQAVCYQQETEKLSEYSSGFRRVCDWEPRGGKASHYLSPTAYLVAQARSRQENNTRLDENGYTIFPYYVKPGSDRRYPKDYAEDFYKYHPKDNILYMCSKSDGKKPSGIGVFWAPRRELPPWGDGVEAQQYYRSTRLEGKFRNGPHFTRIAYREAVSSFK